MATLDLLTHGVPRTSRVMARAAWLGAGALALMFSVLSLLRHARMSTTGYDLGIFEQAVRSYAEGHLPTSLLKGVGYPLLGDHFSPVLALLAPVHMVVPHVEVLLIAQAILLAVGIVPLVLWAGRSLGTTAAVVVGLSYGLAGGLAHAVAFDFHEIAFAVLLLAFALTSLGQKRWRAAALWAAPLVLVKEDLGLTVAAIGILIALSERSKTTFRLGLATAVFGTMATVTAALVLIPAMNPKGANQYTGQLRLESAVTQLSTFFSNDLKLTTLLLLLLPTAFVALRSPLILIAVPTLAWRFLSDNPQYWGTAFHYDAVLVPIVTAAFVDGLIRSRKDAGWSTVHDVFVLVSSTCATIALLTVSPLTQLTSPSLWNASPHELVARDLLTHIPDNASVAASNSLAPHLTGRAEVSLFGMLPLSDSRAQFVIVDTSVEQQFPLNGPDIADLARDAQRDGKYELVASDDGILLLQRSR
jgi:uncharacterized membrane protein